MSNNNQEGFTLTFNEIVYQYLLDKGKVIPVSDEEIEYVTKNLKSEPLPEELKNPSFILDNLNKKSSKFKNLINEKNDENDYNTIIAMAAREGNEKLPNEILKQMLKDRNKIENE